MKALKLRVLFLAFLFTASPGVSTTSLASSDENGAQDSQAAEQKNTETDDEGGNRGFDPCMLNPNLAVCANKQ